MESPYPKNNIQNERITPRTGAEMNRKLRYALIGFLMGVKNYI